MTLDYSIYTIVFKGKLVKKAKIMGHQIKIQRVERGSTKSYYVNFPAALAEAAQIVKGEAMEWLIEDRDTFVLRRLTPQKPVLKGDNPLT